MEKLKNHLLLMVVCFSKIAKQKIEAAGGKIEELQKNLELNKSKK